MITQELTAAEVVEAGESEFCHVACVRGEVWTTFCGAHVKDTSECSHKRNAMKMCDHVCIVCLDMTMHAFRVDACPVCGSPQSRHR